MKTGERIKTIRKSQGITQAKLAETLHISSSFMSRIENGSSSLTLDFVCEIADALQVTRQEVLRERQMKQSHCIRITSNFLQNCILIQ